MTKLSQNPNFGRPSAAKLKQRLASWEKWRNGMRTLAAIKAEIAEKQPEMHQTYGNV
jgi:hypothetical protein